MNLNKIVYLLRMLNEQLEKRLTEAENWSSDWGPDARAVLDDIAPDSFTRYGYRVIELKETDALPDDILSGDYFVKDVTRFLRKKTKDRAIYYFEFDGEISGIRDDEMFVVRPAEASCYVEYKIDSQGNPTEQVDFHIEFKDEPDKDVVKDDDDEY